MLSQVERRSDELRTPGERFAAVDRLVIARDDRLGDLVVTLPAIAALRETYPQAELALLVSPRTVPLARMVTGVDRILAPDGGAEELRRELVAFGAELMVCVSRSLRPAWAAWRAGIPHRLGTAHRSFAVLFTRRVAERRRAGRRHELEYALSFAHRAGASPGPVRFPLQIPGSAEERLESWRRRHGIGDRPIVVHPGSGGSCPRWPAGHFRQLIERLREQGHDVVTSLGAADRALASELTGPVFEDDLELLAALLRSAGLVVASSTGPIHLAAALGAPTLALHAPWPSCAVERWGPYADNGWGLTAEAEGAASWSQAERRRGATRLMSSVAAERVAEVAMAIVAGRAPV